MPNFVRIGAVEDFPEGQGRIISAARKPVAVFKAGGKSPFRSNRRPFFAHPNDHEKKHFIRLYRLASGMDGPP